jgi:hypothetical protein
METEAGDEEGPVRGPEAVRELAEQVEAEAEGMSSSDGAGAPPGEED